MQKKIVDRVKSDVTSSLGIYSVLISLYIIGFITGTIALSALSNESSEVVLSDFKNSITVFTTGYNLFYCAFVSIMNNALTIGLILLSIKYKFFLFPSAINLIINALADGFSFRVLMSCEGVAGILCGIFVILIPAIIFGISRFKLFKTAYKDYKSVDQGIVVFWVLFSFFGVLYQIIAEPIVFNWIF